MQTLEADASWLAGVLDCTGEIIVSDKGPTPSISVRLKTVFPDRLDAVQEVLDGGGHRAGPLPPGKNQVQEQWSLTVTGVAFAKLYNMTLPRLRTSKRIKLIQAYERLTELRKQKGLKSPVIEPRAESIPLGNNTD